MRVVLMATVLLFSVHALVDAELTQQQVEGITQKLREATGDWTNEKTQELLNKAKMCGEFTQTEVRVDGTTNELLRIRVMGETILLNGKDITGNLGSKITYGRNSPVIEGITGSEITVGDASPIRKTSTTVNVGLSVALSLSIVLNVALTLMWRRQKMDNKR